MIHISEHHLNILSRTHSRGAQRMEATDNVSGADHLSDLRRIDKVHRQQVPVAAPQDD